MQNLCILGKNFEITWTTRPYSTGNKKRRLNVYLNNELAGTLIVSFFDDERLNRAAYQLALAYFGLLITRGETHAPAA